MGWHSVRVGDLGRVVTGKTPPSSQPELFHGSVPFITPSDMRDDLRYLETERHVSSAWDPKQRQLLPLGSVCVVCIGATIGKVCMTDQDSHTNQQINSIVADPAAFDARFVYYSLRTKGAELKARAAGAATPIINKSTFSDTVLDMPDLDQQRTVGDILGAYDDLIEVNRKRVALLEEMTRRLFEEWFVRFRFPGHEAVAMVEKNGDHLPEGWETATLGDFLTLQRGFDLPKAERGQGVVPVYSAGGVHGTHAEHKVAGPGVVTGRSGTIGQVSLVIEDFWPLNTTLYVKEFKKGGPALARLLLERMNLAAHAGGAAVPSLNRNHVHGLPVVAAPPALLNKFEAIAMTNATAVYGLNRQNELLAASRDLLLPRLVSGQLSVAQAERELADAA